MDKLYEGKAKALYATTDPQAYLVVYSNQATAFNGEKKAQIEGKGALNNQISSLIFSYLNQLDFATQFIEQVDEVSQLVRPLDMLPIEVVVRNRVAGSLSKVFGIREGSELAHPSVEFYYKNDNLNDPFVNESQLDALGLVSLADSQWVISEALRINQALIGLFEAIEIDLIDFKLEFGKTKAGQIILGDEISPDTCRLWDQTNGQHLDKDNFRRELGPLVPVYREVLDRLQTYINQL